MQQVHHQPVERALLTCRAAGIEREVCASVSDDDQVPWPMERHDSSLSCAMLLVPIVSSLIRRRNTRVRSCPASSRTVATVTGACRGRGDTGWLRAALWWVLCFLPAAAPHAQLLHALHSPHDEYGGSFGRSVSWAGDVDADGFDDVVVGAPGEDVDGTLTDAGRAYVFSGLTGAVLHTLISPNAQGGGLFGWSVSGTGDVNADGKTDVVVGAFREHSGASPMYAGRAYVFSGATGTLLHTLSSPNEQFESHFGISVAGAADVEGEPRIVVGADFESTSDSTHGAGRAYVFSGQSGALSHTLVSANGEAEGEFGWCVSGAADVAGECLAIVIGAHREDPGASPTNAGRAYLYDGQTGVVLRTLISPNEQALGFFGQSVAVVGDADGDGFDDVVIGAFLEDMGPSLPGAGRAYVVSGSTGGVISPLSSPSPESDGRFGGAVAGLGRLCGEPACGMLIGAPREDTAVHTDVGKAYLLDPLEGSLRYTLLSPNPQEAGHFGFALSGLGDVNGDGLPDAVVGAPGESPGMSPSGAGRAYVISPFMVLSGQVGEGIMELSWTACVGASSLWVYGADNAAFFEPILVAPFTNRLTVLPSGTTTWVSADGIGDPEHNWAFLVVATDASERELCHSNRVGEHDFGVPSDQ